MNAEQLSKLQAAQALAAQRQQVAASTQSPPKLSVPLSLGTLFKCLRPSEDGFDFQTSAALTKAEGAASDLVRGVAAVQGQGPLADAAASPNSLRNLGRLITAASHDLKALCDTPPPTPPTVTSAPLESADDTGSSSSSSGAVVAATSVGAVERSEAAAEAAVKAEQVVMLGLAAIRLAALQSLVMLANSDARIAAMVEASVPEVVVRDLLACPTANFDLNGLKAACDLARNLSVAARREPFTRAAMLRANAVPALVTAAVAKARDQNAAVSAAAALRLLLEASEHNATPAANGGAEEKPTKTSSSSLSSAATVDEQPSAVAEALAPCVASILAVNLGTMHPFVRVELARTLALATPLLADRLVDAVRSAEGNAASSDASESNALATTKREASGAALALLSNRIGVEFVGFLLASRQPPLHAEAVAALSALRRAAKSVVVSKNGSNSGAVPPQPPASTSDGDSTAPSSSNTSTSNKAETAPQPQASIVQTPQAPVLDPMVVGANVGADDGTTDQGLAERLTVIRTSGSAGGLSGPVRRQFEAHLTYLLS